MGRPRIPFNIKIHGELIRWMARAGLTNPEMAKELGISEPTLKRWRKRYPELDEIVLHAKNLADARVENTLYRSALGYEYEEESEDTIEEEVPTGKVDAEGMPVFTIKVKTTKHKQKRKALPDTTAGIFWMKNRRPAEWRDRKDVTVNADNPWSEALKGIADKLSKEDMEELKALRGES